MSLINSQWGCLICDENALLAAREIVKWLEVIEALYLPVACQSDLDEELSFWEYDGVVLMIESIIAHQYSEEPRDEPIPFAHD